MSQMATLNRLPAQPTADMRSSFAADFNRALASIGVAPGDAFLIVHPDALDAPPKPTSGLCIHCSLPINEQRDYQRMTGWVRHRGAEGGANAIRAKEPQDEWACAACVERMAAGVDPRQETLV